MPKTIDSRTGLCALKSDQSSYRQVREFTDRIIEPLSAEDCMVQSMDDVSPTRWHIAHTTWFFETFVLRNQPNYEEFHPQFNFLFNSYYNTIGEQFPRPQRGFISRPGIADIKRYRQHVDEHMLRLFESGSLSPEQEATIEVGLHHEQQHQELMLTDIKHVLSCNPTMPEYQPSDFEASRVIDKSTLAVSAGTHRVGHRGTGFSFDNESPHHEVLLSSFEIDRQLVTNGQFLEFMADDGYRRPELWLSMGWHTVNEQRWDAPLYWVQRDGTWFQFTLAGLHEVNPDWPVCHVSYFEADAFARWANRRLPTEFEWEVASQQTTSAREEEPFADYLLNGGWAVHPTRAPTAGLMGSVWQWTSSSYAAYPGYRPPAGAIGEYNGKFMCNQYVLRGGSVATSSSHIRPTYRNFFPPETRWQFSGIRLAD